LTDADLEVGAGEVVGLIGPNGSGKTTLIECAVGTRKPSAGVSRVAGLDTWTHRRRAARYFGVQFQEAELPPFSRVSDTFKLWGSVFGSGDDRGELCREFGIGDKYRASFRTLSGGEKRRALVALAFMGEPRFVVLDEPTAGMDPHARSVFWDAIRRRTAKGAGVLFSSHEMSDMDLNCDRVALMFEGRILASGAVDDVLRLHGARTTYLLNPSHGSDDRAMRIPRMSGITWTGRVLGGWRIVVSDELAAGHVETAIAGMALSQKIVRPSNLEDLFYMLSSVGESGSAS